MTHTTAGEAAAPAVDTDPELAFVLAGGGTKGAFEVGALRHLVGAAGLLPGTVCATSAGSILGAKLAQARSGSEFASRIEELDGDLLAMTDTATVFGRQPWLADFDGTELAAIINRFVQMSPPPPPGVAAEPALARSQHRHRRWHALTEAVALSPVARRAARDYHEHRVSLLTLDPLEAHLRGQAPGSGIRPIDEAAVARPGLRLRLTISALEAGVPRYVTETGHVVEADGSPCRETPDPPGVIEGVLASSSVPMVFAPRRLGEATYVDGGVCDNIPVGAAVACGAERVVAVVAVPLYPPRSDIDFATAPFLTIYERSSRALQFAAMQRTLLAAGRGRGAELTVIAPTVDVVGAFEVNPGLLRIDTSYGEMRAAETLAPLDDADRARAMALSDRITVGRERAWYAEERLWAGEPGAAVLDDVRRAKEDVRVALEARSTLGLPAPAGAASWWSGYESHRGPRPSGVPEDPRV